MKKLLVATIAVIGLVGCTVEVPQSDSSNDNSYTPAPQKSEQEIIEDTYLSLIYAEYPSVRSMGDYSLLNLGRNLCSEIDNGMTLEQLAAMAIQYGVDAEMLGFITGSAIAAFCPWNSGFFDRF